MTTVIGMIYRNGVMMFSDTAETLEGDPRVAATKNYFEIKLHPIGQNIVIGCAGPSSSTINAFVNHAKEKCEDETILSNANRLYCFLREELISSFFERDRKLAEQIYGRPTTRKIDIEALFAARLKDGQYVLYKIMVKLFGDSIKYDDIGVKEIQFGGIGTGGAKQNRL